MASNTAQVTNCMINFGSPLPSASRMAANDPGAASMMLSFWRPCSAVERHSGKGQRRGIDVDAGIHLDPGFLALLDGADQRIFNGRCGRYRTGPSTVSLSLYFSLYRAGRALQGLDLLAWLHPRAAWRPDPVIGLAVLGLELRPADHPLRRIEPEPPLVLARRSNPVEQGEIPAFVGGAVLPEMQHKERFAPGKIEPMESYPAIVD